MNDSSRRRGVPGDPNGLSPDSALNVVTPNAVLDLADVSMADAGQRIDQLATPEDDEAPWRKIKLENLPTHQAWLPFFNSAVIIQIFDAVPDGSFFYMSKGEVDCRGGGGRWIASGLSGGVVRIRGSVGDGVGCCLSGGTLAIHGNAGHRVGGGMVGGGIMVRGSLGDDAAIAATGGTVVVGGQTGRRLGHQSRDVTFFVHGEVASLGDEIVEAPMRKQAQLRLGVLLMNASVKGSPASFRRYMHRDALRAEMQSLGEISPSWR